MRHALLGLREPFRCSGAIGGLPEDRRVAVAIRLERDARRVGGPERIAVLAAERQPPHRRRARQIVNPDHLLLAIVDAERNAGAVGRDTRRLELADGQFQRLHFPFSIHDDGGRSHGKRALPERLQRNDR